MADETITGCYDRDTGSITFTQESACGSECKYEDVSCYVVSGVHAGQIALVLDTDNCDDTYYGCIDPSTGLFKVTVPDNCCTLSNWCGLCDSCESPERLQVDILGDDCPGCHEEALGSYKQYTNINGIIGRHIVERDSTRPGIDCTWKKTITLSSPIRLHVWRSVCGGQVCCSGCSAGECSPGCDCVYLGFSEFPEWLLEVIYTNGTPGHLAVHINKFSIATWFKDIDWGCDTAEECISDWECFEPGHVNSLMAGGTAVVTPIY
jgi:hypothetical protein